MSRFLILAVLTACTSETTPTTDPVDTVDDTAADDTGTAEPGPLLVNGDAELCSLEGWAADTKGTIDAVEKQDQGETAPVVFPFRGDCFFSFAVGPVAKSHGLTQTGEVFPDQVLTLNGQFKTRDFEFATVTLQSMGTGGVLNEAVSGKLNADEWSPFSLSLVTPPGTLTYLVEMRAFLKTGSFTNVYFDNLELTAIGM